MSGSYVKHIVTPPNTTKENKVRTNCTFSTGLLTEIKIAFPPGCADLLRVQLLEYESVIIPHEPDSYVAWNDYVWIIPCAIQVVESFDNYTILTWNLDTIYSHTLSIAFEILPNLYNIYDRVDNLENAVFGSIDGT